MAVFEIFFPCLLLSSSLPWSEAAIGIKYPYLANADIGRGINRETGVVKEILLRDDFERKKVKVTKVTTKYDFVQDESDVAELLDVGGELKFGINAGFTLNIEGRAHYKRDKGNTKDDLELLFSINVLDYYEMVPDIEWEGREDCHQVAADARDVTHIIGGIIYGAQCTVSVVWKSTTEEQRKAIMGELNLEFGKKGKFGIRIGGKVQFNNSNEKSKHNYNFKSSCNMPISKYPASIDEVIKFANSMPDTYAATDDVDRGVGLSMYLVPIDEVDSCKDISSKKSNLFSPAPIMQALFVEMENKLEDYDAAIHELGRCKKRYPMQIVNNKDVALIDEAFYTIKRIMSRRSVLLREELVDTREEGANWTDPNKLLEVMERFDQKYFELVSKSITPELKTYMKKVIGVDEIRIVEEGDEEERTPTKKRQLIGNKVWRQRVKMLCKERNRVSNTLRAEF